MNKKILISAIQNHVNVFNGQQVKAFYESDLGFTDVFTEEDNYMDFFKSNMYLENHIKGNEDEIEDRLIDLGIKLNEMQDDDDIKNIKRWLKTIKIVNNLPIENTFKIRVLKMIDDAINMADAKSYLGIMIFVGSVLEGILLGLLQNDKDAKTIALRNTFANSTSAPKKKDKFFSPIFKDLVDFANLTPKKYYAPTMETRTVAQEYKKANSIPDEIESDFGKWELNDLISVAQKEGFFEDKTGNKAKIIQSARNYVHPNEQVKVCDFTSENAQISVNCLVEVVKRLIDYFK